MGAKRGTAEAQIRASYKRILVIISIGHPRKHLFSLPC